MTEDNGMLAWVPGDFIAAGIAQLPLAGPGEEDAPVRQVVVDVPDLGPVGITYELRTYRHRKTRLWHWVAVRAEL